MSLRVAVVCGGASAEAEVSRKSADGVVAALSSAGHSVTRHELDAGLASRLATEQPDVVFPITHGTLGEDGFLQGLLEIVNVPYVGCDVLASAVATNKPLAKQIWRNAGLPVAPNVVVTRGANVAAAAEASRAALGAAVVIKPSQGGSAIGVHRVGAAEPVSAIAAAIEAVLGEYAEAMIEPMLSGAEVTCGVFEPISGSPIAFSPTLILPQRADFYDFASKYAPGGSKHVCPAPLAPEVTALVRELAVRAHVAVGARDMSRTDFFVDESQSPAKVTLLEINTLPGMTATSLYPEAAAIAGINFPSLCDKLVSVAHARPRRAAPKALSMPA